MARFVTFATVGYTFCIALCLSASVTNQAWVPPSDFPSSGQATGDPNASEGSTAAPPTNVKRTNFYSQPQQPPPQQPPQQQPGSVFNNSFPPSPAASAGGAQQPGPQTDLVVVAGFLVESLLVHKAAVVNAIAAFIGHLFGNLAVTFSRMAATILGIPLPSKKAPPQTPIKRMDSGLNARNSKSGPMGDNQGYTDDRNAFMVPILNRPLQYQDFQMMQRLVMESIDVYNKWQKKSSTNEGPSPRRSY